MSSWLFKLMHQSRLYHFLVVCVVTPGVTPQQYNLVIPRTRTNVRVRLFYRHRFKRMELFTARIKTIPLISGMKCKVYDHFLRGMNYLTSRGFLFLRSWKCVRGKENEKYNSMSLKISRLI